jgi:hypothetical protein
MIQKHYLPATLAALALASNLATAQISLTAGPGLTYSQDWGTGYAASTNAWTDNSVFSGWYAYQNGTSNAPANYYVSTSTAGTTTGRFYLIASTSEPANFGFGGRVSDGTSGVLSNPDAGFYLGLRLSNNTGGDLAGFSLGYTGGQFAKAANVNPNSITVSYQLGSPGNLVAGTWQAVPTLDFTGPVADASGATGLDFNAAANQTVFSPVDVTGLTWADGTDLWIRFKINNVGGIDHGLLIDDVNFVAAVPEPTTATLMGLGLLAIVARLRSRK